jgi:hypothetical protein
VVEAVGSEDQEQGDRSDGDFDDGPYDEGTCALLEEVFEVGAAASEE